MASSQVPKTARDILLAKVGEIVQEATQHKTAGENRESLSLYQRAVEILQALLNNETDENFKLQLDKQLKEISAEKDALAQEQSILEKIPLSDANRSRKESTACEIVLSVENVCVHKILGLGERSPERMLIGRGVLRILRCQPPPESPKQKPKLETMTETELESEMVGEMKTQIEDKRDETELCLLQLLPANDDSQFQFPLTKSIPCLCTSPGYYIFPMSGNLFYGVVFPSEIPPTYVTVFENVLERCCNLRRVEFPEGFQPPQPPAVENEELALTTMSTANEIIVAPTSVPLAAQALSKLSEGINTGANALCGTIATGSHFIATSTRTGGDFIKSRLTPAQEPAKVPGPVVNTVLVAGKLSPVCVAVSKVLIASLSSLADEVGKTVAKGIKSKSGKVSGPKGPTATAAKEAGKSTLQAVANIWDALEQAGKLLLNETSSVTVDLVDTKYGAQAAQVTKDSMKVAGDVITTAYNLDQLGLKKIVTKAAKRSATHTVHDMIETEEQLALPGPEPKLALPAPHEKLALPAPEPAEKKLG